jgi:alpha,alpha-trehalase
MSNTAISDHALLSDRHSSALVDRSGSVEWLNFPRFDSPSVFGRLLSPDAGHWSITPSGDWTSARRYLDRTLVLETTFTTANWCPRADRSTRTRAQQWRTSARHERPAPPGTPRRL